ncbi:MAG: monovalent cation/H+ antiporter complex subunit F [Thermodesulfobacteriota bacterium]
MLDFAFKGAMESFLVFSGICLLLMMFMPLYRAVRGPSTIDRLVGVNVIGTKTTILIVIIGTLYHRVDMFVDIALTYALLNFIASLAAARLFQRHRKVDLVQTERRGGQC